MYFPSKQLIIHKQTSSNSVKRQKNASGVLSQSTSRSPENLEKSKMALKMAVFKKYLLTITSPYFLHLAIFVYCLCVVFSSFNFKQSKYYETHFGMCDIYVRPIFEILIGMNSSQISNF